MKFDFEGFVPTQNGPRFTRVRFPQKSAPSLVFLNGLSYSTSNWLPTIQEISDQHLGLLLFDFSGQGKTLNQQIESYGSYDFQPSVDQQSEDLIDLLNHFNMDQIDLLIGLSYGAGIGFNLYTNYAQRFNRFLAIAPYIMRLDHSSPINRYWASQAQLFKSAHPANRIGVDIIESAYNQYISYYMNKRFENEITCKHQRQAAIKLALGIMPFNVFDLMHELSTQEIHLVLPGNDTLIPKGLSSELWQRLPDRCKHSRLHVEDAGHIVPKTAPGLLAHWIEKVISQRVQGDFSAYSTDSSAKPA